MGVPDPNKPTLNDYPFALRAKIIAEEAAEFAEACGLDPNETFENRNDQLASLRKGPHDWVKMIDALCDILYVTYGAATAMGVDLEPMFDAVHAANMRKLGPNGQVAKREDGKILKPADWCGPEEDIRDALDVQLFFGKLDESPRPLGNFIEELEAEVDASILRELQRKLTKDVGEQD